MFTENDLQSVLSKTLIQQIDFHDELDSTNSQSTKICEQGDMSTPLLVLTSNQTAGRGRGKNTWWSQSGSLTFSVILDVEQLFQPQQLALISLSTGWAISSFIKKLLPQQDIKIKWPNDLYLEQRKVCGILTETVNSHYVVVGIGLNVNNSLENVPDSFQNNVTSLVEFHHENFSLTDILIDLLHELDVEWKRLAEGKSDFISQWSQRCLLTGKQVTHQAGNTETTGKCLGINCEGALLLQTKTGFQKLYGGTIINF